MGISFKNQRILFYNSYGNESLEQSTQSWRIVVVLTVSRTLYSFLKEVSRTNITILAFGKYMW